MPRKMCRCRWKDHMTSQLELALFILKLRVASHCNTEHQPYFTFIDKGSTTTSRRYQQQCNDYSSINGSRKISMIRSHYAPNISAYLSLRPRSVKLPTSHA